MCAMKVMYILAFINTYNIKDKIKKMILCVRVCISILEFLKCVLRCIEKKMTCIGIRWKSYYIAENPKLFVLRGINLCLSCPLTIKLYATQKYIYICVFRFPDERKHYLYLKPYILYHKHF